MEALRENIFNGTKKIVPYRDSKLTLLFKNYFEGNGKLKMLLCINPRSIEFDETINVLKFSDLVKDILVPVATNELQRHIKKSDVSIDTLEQSCAQFFGNYTQRYVSIIMTTCTKVTMVTFLNLKPTFAIYSNHLFAPEAFPALDVFTPDDPVTINVLIDHLEDYRRKQTPFLHEFESLRQQFFSRIKDTFTEIERIKEERDEYKNRLDSKEKDQNKIDSKIRALEKVINNNNYRTPMTNKENSNNRPTFATPARTGSAGSNGSSHHITGTVAGHASKFENITNQQPSTISDSRSNVPKTPISSTFIRSSETPMQSTYRSTARFGSTVTQSISRYNNHLPPQTPLKEGVPVANKRNRRSKSAEMWLDHKPANTAKIGKYSVDRIQRHFNKQHLLCLFRYRHATKIRT